MERRSICNPSGLVYCEHTLGANNLKLTRAKSEPRSPPKPKRTSWADEEEAVDIEIQTSPPYRIVTKPKKPKTPPPPRPFELADTQPQRSASMRSPKREVLINRDGNIEFKSHQVPTKLRTVTFKDQVDSAPKTKIQKSPDLSDILKSVEALRIGEKIKPVITNPGDSPPTIDEKLKEPPIKVGTPLEKPKIENVKLAKSDLTVLSKSRHGSMRRQTSQSLEGINRTDILLDLCDMNLSLKHQCLRSSFVDPDTPSADTRRSIYIDLGDYQTLLKHSKREEHVYSLPQPLCYGNDTLRAVKMITDKYDTFKRRQLQAQSFGAEGALKMEEDQGGTVTSPDIPVAPEAVTDIVENIPSGQEKPSDVPSTDSQAQPSTSHADSVDCASSSAQPTNKSTLLSERALDRIDMFYRSHGAEIKVCRCLADVYIGTKLQGCEEVGQWQAYHTGVPVLVLNTGVGRRRRELNVLIAEESSGFPLWQDRVSYLTSYTGISPTEHTLYLSGSLHKMAKLRFSHRTAASEFLAHFHEITSDPNDDLWKVSCKSKEKNKFFKSKRKHRKPSKKEISQPCNFSHITRLNAEPTTPPISSQTQTPDQGTEEEFRPRLPTH